MFLETARGKGRRGLAVATLPLRSLFSQSPFQSGQRFLGLPQLSGVKSKDSLIQRRVKSVFESYGSWALLLSPVGGTTLGSRGFACCAICGWEERNEASDSLFVPCLLVVENPSEIFPPAFYSKNRSSSEKLEKVSPYLIL